MSLRPSPGVQDQLDDLDPDLRAAAGAIGAAIGAELARIRPALVRGSTDDDYEPEAVLLGLELEREGLADAVALSACLTAHRVYVESRGHPEAVSLGALPSPICSSGHRARRYWGRRRASTGLAPLVVVRQ